MIRKIVFSIACFILWIVLSVWQPLGVSPSSWLQFFTGLLIAYTVTVSINNDNKKRAITLQMIEIMEKDLFVIENLLNESDVTTEDIQFKIIPKTSQITTFASFCSEEGVFLPKSAERLKIFRDEFNKLRELISNIVDNIERKKIPLAKAEAQLQKCKNSIWKIRISLYL